MALIFVIYMFQMHVCTTKVSLPKKRLEFLNRFIYWRHYKHGRTSYWIFFEIKFCWVELFRFLTHIAFNKLKNCSWIKLKNIFRPKNSGAEVSIGTVGHQDTNGVHAETALWRNKLHRPVRKRSVRWLRGFSLEVIFVVLN